MILALGHFLQRHFGLPFSRFIGLILELSPLHHSTLIHPTASSMDFAVEKIGCDLRPSCTHCSPPFLPTALASPVITHHFCLPIRRHSPSQSPRFVSSFVLGRGPLSLLFHGSFANSVILGTYSTSSYFIGSHVAIHPVCMRNFWSLRAIRPVSSIPCGHYLRSFSFSLGLIFVAAWLLLFSLHLFPISWRQYTPPFKLTQDTQRPYSAGHSEYSFGL